LLRHDAYVRMGGLRRAQELEDCSDANAATKVFWDRVAIVSTAETLNSRSFVSDIADGAGQREYGLEVVHGQAPASRSASAGVYAARLFRNPPEPTLSFTQFGTALMPRKIRPKYGIDPVQEVPAFSFTDAQIEHLFALAPVEGDRREIAAQLERCARDYFWLRNQNQKKPTRAEQNAALKEVGQLARGLEMRLRSLDTDTEWELMVTAPAFHTSNFTDSVADLADRAEQALRAGKQNSGRRIQTHVQRTVVRLANFYEQFTGEPFSHNPKLLTEYDGTPHSPAGNFMVAFFQIVDPKISSTSLSTAMASIVKFRRARDKAASS
jgi:hypothetical protein